MSETLPVHELIASDDYWSTIAKLPELSFRDRLVDDLSSIYVVSADSRTKDIQTLLTLANATGFDPIAVSNGSQLPLLERGEGLLKVVEDTRTKPAKSTNTHRLFQSSDKPIGTEEFNEIAQKMLAEFLYFGKTAMTHVVDELTGEVSYIERRVIYCTGSKSGSQLEGVISSNMHGASRRDIDVNELIRPVRVGRAYNRNALGTYASKVIAADLILPVYLRKSSKNRRSKLLPARALRLGFSH